ncbi:MAG: hypothetical protein ACLFRD_02320 [Nitriliruptoraceae bacterium]
MPSGPSPAGSLSNVADGSSAPAALPVRLELDLSEAEPVRRWLEGVLGWQPIDTDTAALVPPAVSLVGPSALAEGSIAAEPDVGERTPCVLVVGDDADPVAVGRSTAVGRPDAVIGWPSGRDELSEVVADVLAVPPRSSGRSRLLRIGGAAGGVGTTVVSLAIAGLEGWRGRATVAAIRRLSLTGAAIETAALADADLWSRASALQGVTAARLVRLADGQVPPEPRDPRVETLVVDAGVDRDVDVLVCRRDAAGLEALAATTAAAVVVVGDGPVAARELAACAGGRRGVALPWSARVSRADRHGRVPGGLPGAWLRRLLPLVPERVDTVQRSTVALA